MEDELNRPWRVFVLSNSHWDREWYMSHERYLVRLVGLFDHLLPIMEANPDYIFLTDGQYAMLGDYLTARPEKRPLIERLVKDGRLLVGPWYTQPLETIVSGEGMVRNLQYGIRASLALGGVMRCSYMIDEFGHASQTPQVLRGFGIDSAIAWRGMAEDTKSTFRWNAADGTAVDMFFSNDGYGEATALPDSEEEDVQTIDGQKQVRPGLLEKVPNLLRFRGQHADTDCIMWLNGIDHSWAQPDILSVIEKINRLFPEITVKQTSPLTFVSEVRKDYAAKGLPLTEKTGELMDTGNDVLESTHALHARQKKAQANTERNITRRTEPLTTAAWLLGGEDAAWGLTRAWTYLLENHAHDSLGCSSVDEVYERVMDRYRCCASLSEQLTENALRAIMARGAEETSLWFFNSATTAQGGVGVYTFDLPETMGVETGFRLLTADGTEIPYTVLNCERVSDIRYQPRRGHPTLNHAARMTLQIQLPTVPAFGWVRLHFENRKNRMLENRRQYYHTTSAASFENPYLAVSIASDGTVALTDKIRNVTYPDLLRYEDDGEGMDCYVHCTPRYDARVIKSIGSPARISELYDTALGTSWQIDLDMRIPRDVADDPKKTRRSAEEVIMPIRTVLTLQADSRRLDVTVTVQNTAKNHRLRVLFPTGLTAATVSRGGQPFDMVERKIHEDLLPNRHEQLYATHPMQDICDVSEKERGFAVLSADTYEYECTDTRERALAITLLRAVDVIGCGEFAENPDFRMKEAQVQGELTYRLALVPHGADFDTVYAQADAFLLPPLCRVNRAPETSVMQDYVAPARDLCDSASLFCAEGEGLRITGIQKTFDRASVCVRILNTGEKEQAGRLYIRVPGKNVRAVYETDLEENRQRAVSCTENAVSFALRSRGIMTLEIEFD